jgi:hypothetical protein
MTDTDEDLQFAFIFFGTWSTLLRKYYKFSISVLGNMFHFQSKQCLLLVTYHRDVLDLPPVLIARFFLHFSCLGGGTVDDLCVPGSNTSTSVYDAKLV